MDKGDERLLRDLSQMSQEATKDNRQTAVEVAHSIINEILDDNEKEKK